MERNSLIIILLTLVACAVIGALRQISIESSDDALKYSVIGILAVLMVVSAILIHRNWDRFMMSIREGNEYTEEGTAFIDSAYWCILGFIVVGFGTWAASYLLAVMI